jgi:hypothetical protein
MNTIVSKRIAFLYYGKLRTFFYVYNNHLDNLIMPLRYAGHTCDIYIHTWRSVIEDPTDIVNYIYNVVRPVRFLQDDQSCYDVSTIMDNLILPDDNEIYPHVMVKNHLYALESQRRVYAMCEQNYDLMCVIRPDSWFTEKIDSLISCCGSLGISDIFLPNSGYFNGYNASMAMGNMSVIKKYVCRQNSFKNYRTNHGLIDPEKNVESSFKRIWHYALQL